MTNEIFVLAGTAASIGFIHTVIGPDHYLPFIVMARARRWPLSKTLIISFLCGLGHVLSSVVLGFLGIGLGIAVTKLEGVESFRGSLAAWLLIGFGLAYFVWGLHRALRNRPHTHVHAHSPSESPRTIPTRTMEATSMSMTARVRPISRPGSSSRFSSSDLASR